MKTFEKFLLVGMVAILAVHFWPQNRPPANQPAAPEKMTAATPSAQPASAEAPATVTLIVPKPADDPQVHRLALLHSKLAGWQAAEARDSMDDEDARAELMKDMIAMVTDANVVQVVQSLSPDEMNTPFGTAALHHWMQLDPVAAANWIAARPETTDRQTLEVADDMVGNPDSLHQYLAQVPDTAWKQSFLEQAAAEMSPKDPLEAISLAQQMKPGDAQTNLLKSVACTWVGSNPDALLDWVQQVKDPALREQLIAAAAQSYALTDPAQAATWLVSEIKSDAVAKDAAIGIVGTWVMTDPAAAADWVGQFPDGDTRAAATKIIAQHWQQTDPAAATKWMQNLAGANQSAD